MNEKNIGGHESVLLSNCRRVSTGDAPICLSCIDCTNIGLIFVKLAYCILSRIVIYYSHDKEREVSDMTTNVHWKDFENDLAEWAELCRLKATISNDFSLPNSTFHQIIETLDERRGLAAMFVRDNIIYLYADWQEVHKEDEDTAHIESFHIGDDWYDFSDNTLEHVPSVEFLKALCDEIEESGLNSQFDLHSKVNVGCDTFEIY